MFDKLSEKKQAYLEVLKNKYPNVRSNATYSLLLRKPGWILVDEIATSMGGDKIHASIAITKDGINELWECLAYPPLRGSGGMQFRPIGTYLAEIWSAERRADKIQPDCYDRGELKQSFYQHTLNEYIPNVLTDGSNWLYPDGKERYSYSFSLAAVVYLTTKLGIRYLNFTLQNPNDHKQFINIFCTPMQWFARSDKRIHPSGDYEIQLDMGWSEIMKFAAHLQKYGKKTQPTKYQSILPLIEPFGHIGMK